MRCNFCSVAAGTHAAPSAPVILRGIIEKKVATFIRTLSNQRWVRVAKEIRRRFGERGQQRQRVGHLRHETAFELSRTSFDLKMAVSLF